MHLASHDAIAASSHPLNGYQLQPSVFYDWLKQVQGNLVGALMTSTSAGP